LWIGTHMGAEAADRFSDQTGGVTINYSRAVNQKRNDVIVFLTRLKKNLREMIESKAWQE